MLTSKKIISAFVIFSIVGVISAQPGLISHEAKTNPSVAANALAPLFHDSACGLNYIYDTTLVETRYNPFTTTGTYGSGLPAKWVISGLPACYALDSVFVWMLCSYQSPTAPGTTSITITNPASSVKSFASGGPIATDGPKCWGETGTAVYRWGIPKSFISGNGNYTFNFSGFTNPNWEIDGATLFIIYRDPSANYQGNITLWDGAVASGSGSPLSQTMTGFNVCAAPTSARAFTLSSDHQDNVAPPTHITTLNGVNANFPNLFYDEDEASVTLLPNQTSSVFGMDGSGGNDCYLWAAMGLYYQTTTCTTCIPSALSVSVATTNAGCGSPNGTAAVTIISGTAPYTYLWNPGGQTTSSITGLSAGTYTVTVTDANNCTSVINNITISNSPPVVFSFSSVTNVKCFGNNTGSASVNISSGTPPYTYSWNPSGQTTSTATGLSAGTYSVTVTDAMGCTSSNTITITSPTALTHSFSGVVNINCFGNNNGSATVNVSGGVPAYTYSWNPSGQTTSAATGLVAGIYTITVTDANGCTFSDTVTITSPTALSHSFSAITNIDCFGNNNGSATVNVSGGTPAYTYSWSNSQTSQNATGLVAGTYTITVTDSHGCTFSDTVAITTPTALSHTFSGVVNINCFGNNNGSATVNVSGGTPAYTYLWNPAAVTTAAATGLSAGTYTITVTDSHGCTFLDSVQITTPPPLTHAIPPTNPVDCFGNNTGSASVNVAGGTPGYTYSWSPPLGSQTTQTATALYAGVYTVTVTDANGCTFNDTALITSPTGLGVFSSTIINVDCFGNSTGMATVNPFGGTPGYTYFWNPTLQTSQTATGLAAGVYTITVTDNNGCIIKTLVQITEPTLLTSASSQINILCFGDSTGTATVSASGGTLAYTYLWNNGQTTSAATNIPAGNYSVLVTDSHGCTTTSSVTLTQPVAPLSAASSVVNVLCNPDSTGSATISVSGGTPGYTYLWNTNSTSASISNLPAGNYSVLITDANGCADSATLTITQPPLLTASAAPDTNICAGMNAPENIFAAGGTPGYTYVWMPGGATTSSITVSPSATTTYTVQVTDNNGCVKNDTVHVAVWNLPAIVAQSDTSICLGGNATLTASGGISYLWNNGATTSSIVTADTSAVIYAVIGTDANGCSNSDSVSVQMNVMPVANFGYLFSPECEKVVALFSDSSLNATAWQWNFGSGTSNQQNPVFDFTYQNSYTVSLTALLPPCSDTVSKSFSINDFSSYIVTQSANVFSPNGDGINDCFQMITNGKFAGCAELTVYNRWGIPVYYSEYSGACWDGKTTAGVNVPEGTYLGLSQD
ncbi:MAG: gliding motility-associated C-terminal domain-containing protein [Bacteroidetes bacterium]|nr:gliding motility-associated C-terminal domain-containing protein [Bacteroidota bacterium]